MHRKGVFLSACSLGILSLMGLLGCQAATDVRREPPTLEGVQNCLQRSASSQDVQGKRNCVYALETFVAANREDPQAAEADFRLGQLYLETGDSSAAYHLFRSFPEAHPMSPRQAQARLYLGVSLYFLNNPTDSLAVLHELTKDPNAAAWSEEIFRYIAEDYVKLGILPSALTWYARCYESMKDEAGKERVRKRTLEVLSIGWEPEALQAASDLFQEGFFAEAIQLGVAATCVQKGQIRIAEDHLRRMSVQHHDDLFTPHIHALLEQIALQGQPQICTIGCLLPLSGKYERFGKSVLNAILLGARAFESEEGKGASIRLMIRDTQGDPEVAVKRLRELAADPSVMGIVGPLRASVALACAEEAQKLGLPMIALTQKEEVARVGDYVFQNGLTIRQQVDTLVEFVMEQMGFSSFAVLYPKDAYGMLSRDLMEKKVLDMGGQVVSQVPYELAETDFQDEIRLLVGAEFLRELERRERKRERERLLEQGMEVSPEGEPIEGTVAEGEEEPLHPPFEVLFIPDSYRKVALIAPHLAYYEVNEVTLLGTNAWNSPQLVELAGEYVRDAIFADGFFAESDIPYVREFVETYQRAFQSKPRSLEAQGYDSLLMLESSFLQAPVKTRQQVRDALARIQGYPGLSGYTSFNEDGSAKKRLYLLSIIRNQIQQIN